MDWEGRKIKPLVVGPGFCNVPHMPFPDMDRVITGIRQHFGQGYFVLSQAKTRNINGGITHAITMGVGTILEAERVIMLANGKSKSSVGAQVSEGPVTSMITASALLDRCPVPSREQIREALAGVICRCTGYQQIFESVEAAVARDREATGTPPTKAGS